MRTTSPLTLLAAVLALGACSSSTPTGSNNNGNNGNNANVHGTMTATVNGSAFSASYLARATASGNIISINGEQVVGTNVTSVTFAIGNISVDSFSLSNTDQHGGNAIVTLGSTAYSSAASGGSGFVVFTAYDSTHIAGNFSFVGVASTGTATVTNGKFDLAF